MALSFVGNPAQTVSPLWWRTAGNVLYKNGVAWAPKGANLFGFTIPPARADSTFLSYQALFPANLTQIKTKLNADTVRFQISQPALDPQNAIYDSTYASFLYGIMAQTVAAGFIVIVGMNAQSPSGDPANPAMPDGACLRAWQTLLPYVGGNPAMLLGIFNEPHLDTSSPSQVLWGSTHNTLIAGIRAAGANNLLILNGLNYGKYLNGLGARVVDPLNHWVLGVHPYFDIGFFNSTDWAAYFGNEAATYPMICDEWTTTPTVHCLNAAAGPAMVAYLKTVGGHPTRGVGLTGWAAEIPKDLFVDQVSYVLTDFLSMTACLDGTSSGPGALLAAF